MPDKKTIFYKRAAATPLMPHTRMAHHACCAPRRGELAAISVPGSMIAVTPNGRRFSFRAVPYLPDFLQAQQLFRIFVHMKKLPIVFLVFFTSGCVSTKVFSLKDPAYANKHFHRVLIFGDFSKIEYQQAFEDQLADDLISAKVPARSSYQLMPPLREYSDSEKVAIYQQNHFDCYIVISPQEADTRTYHVPTYTTATASVYGNANSAYGSGNSVTSGGYAEKQISGYNFKLELFDFQNGHLVCRCEATTDLKYNAYGQTWASMGDVESSACSNLADELLRNEIFVAPQE